MKAAANSSDILANKSEGKQEKAKFSLFHIF